MHCGGVAMHIYASVRACASKVYGSVCWILLATNSGTLYCIYIQRYFIYSCKIIML